MYLLDYATILVYSMKRKSILLNKWKIYNTEFYMDVVFYFMYTILGTKNSPICSSAIILQ